MKISEMFLGQTDANNEMQTLTENGFLRLFEDIPGCSIDKLLDGSAAFVCGDKGTGKTMLLRFAELQAKQAASPTRFIRYKRDIGERDHTLLNQTAASNGDIEACDDGIQKTNVNLVLAWKLYLIKNIVDLIRESAENIVERNDAWNDLCALIDDIYLGGNNKPIRTILPKITKGQIRIKTTHAELILDCEPSNSEDRRVHFSDAAETVVDCYRELIADNDCNCPIYIFIDEIELHYSKRKEYERELKMVGCLVSAVDSLNSIAREKGLQAHIVLALRNEVHRATVNLGAEINKPIEDFGMQLNWRTKTSEESQPLLHIVETRIRHNYEERGLAISDVWSSLFPDEIDGADIKSYLIRQTWYKPRDIIRYLNALKARCGEETRFPRQAFFDVRKEYSAQAWKEIEEELTAIYKRDQIEAMRKVLNGIRCPFSLADLRKKVEGEISHYQDVEKLSQEFRDAELIAILFHAGIIGNVTDSTRDTGRARFVAWEESEPDLSGKFTIHYPLRSFFDVR